MGSVNTPKERKSGMINPVMDRLLASPESVIRYKVSVYILGYDPESPQIQELRQEIRSSPVVQTLLSEQGSDGKIPYHPYAKWLGAHWILASLADLAYPPGDESLKPMLEQSYAWLLSPFHLKSVRTINRRARRCASQEGNLLYYGCALGFADDRSQELAERLVRWQWPDGGWNCDKRPEAVNSSYMESLIPMRGLAIYARMSGDPDVTRAVERVSEIFLKRALFKRLSDGSIIHEDFIKLHYPPYWHYDILFALKVMAEAGFIGDPRCQPALDLLQSKRLPDGGFPADGKYYHSAKNPASGRSRVDWGGTSKRVMNEYVTVDALSVLKSAGRML
jgi:hypothetical protein